MKKTKRERMPPPMDSFRAALQNPFERDPGKTTTIYTQQRRLNNNYYRTFADFKAGSVDCLTKIEIVYQTEVKTLMTLIFQPFKKDHFMTL